MRLNDLLNQYINQSNVSMKTSGSGQLQPLTNQVAAQIKALAPGQILQGEVLENLGDTVKLLVNVNGENVTLQAKLEQNIMLALGKSLLFQVKNNGSSLQLSPLFENMGLEQNAAKALETASLPVNEKTMEMTAKMMQEGISIDKNTLQEVYQQVISNRDAELMDIIDLHKLNLPVDADNLNQIHSYKTMTHQLAGGIEQLSRDFLQLVQELSQGGRIDDAESLFRAVLNPEDGNIPNTDSGSVQAAKYVLTEDGVIAGEIRQQNETLHLQKEPITVQENNTAHIIAKENDSIWKNMSQTELLQNIQQELEACKGNASALQKLLQQSSFRDSVKEFLLKQLCLLPEETQKDNVQEMYQRLGKQLQTLTQALSNMGQEQSSLGKTVQNLNQNVQFLNQVNQMYAYIQLPLKLTENNAHGELYVYSNRKHLAEGDGEVSALLHLDMEHLGPVDVYVRMKETKVSTNFYLAENELLDFLYEHMELLTSRLEKRGYQMSYELTVKGKQDSDGNNSTFQELLNENSNKPVLVNYSFDVRA